MVEVSSPVSVVSESALAALLGTSRQHIHQLKRTESGMAWISDQLDSLSEAFRVPVVNSEPIMVMTTEAPKSSEDQLVTLSEAVSLIDSDDLNIERLRKWTVRQCIPYETRRGRGPTGEVKLVRLSDVRALLADPPKEGAAGRRPS